METVQVPCDVPSPFEIALADFEHAPQIPSAMPFAPVPVVPDPHNGVVTNEGVVDDLRQVSDVAVPGTVVEPPSVH